MGFGIPLDRWFRGELKDELRSVLLDPRTLARGLFRPESVETMVDEHATSKRDHAYRLWALLMLELWFRQSSGSVTRSILPMGFLGYSSFRSGNGWLPRVGVGFSMGGGQTLPPIDRSRRFR